MISDLRRRKLRREAPPVRIHKNRVVTFTHNEVEVPVAVIRGDGADCHLEVSRSYDFTAAELLALAEKFADYQDGAEARADMRRAIQEAKAGVS